MQQNWFKLIFFDCLCDLLSATFCLVVHDCIQVSDAHNIIMQIYMYYMHVIDSYTGRNVNYNKLV